jgi:MFS family permease
MTGFAMTIWAYELTGSATALALVGFFFVTPMLIISPLAGAIVDRSDRKFMMMISDLASGIATIALLVLYSTGNLQIWHLYITGAIQGTFQTFQWPAYSATISTMLPRSQYGRANGMMSLAESGSGIFAPLLAGVLLGIVGIAGILIIDIASFIAAIGALLLVYVPQPQVTEEGRKGHGSIWKESAMDSTISLNAPACWACSSFFSQGTSSSASPGNLRSDDPGSHRK